MSVQTITDALLLELKESGIKERTICKNYACFYRSFCKESGNKELDEKVIASFLQKKRGKDIWNLAYCQLSRWEQICKHAFHVLLEYQATDQLETRHKIADNPNSKDTKVLEEYLQLCTDAGNATRTLSRKQATIRRFLIAYSLNDTDSTSILAYVQSFVGKSTYYQKRELDEIRKFLGFCFPRGYINQDFDAVFPDIKALKDSKLPSFYTDGEIKKLLQHLATGDSVNKLRDYAMVLLMAVYGFRSIDISCLECKNLDFENGVILFSQSKTGTIIRHNLLPHVGNVLIDYILNERPQSGSSLLFLKADGTGLSSKSVSGVVRNTFLSCSIDIGKRKYGSHSLRHSLATSMINSDHSIFTVANVLGQTSAATARLYAKVDISRLAYCALEVPSNA